MAWPQLGFLSLKSTSVTGHLSSLSLSLTPLCVSAFLLSPLSVTGYALLALLGASHLPVWLVCPALSCSMGPVAPSPSHGSRG